MVYLLRVGWHLHIGSAVSAGKAKEDDENAKKRDSQADATTVRRNWTRKNHQQTQLRARGGIESHERRSV